MTYASLLEAYGWQRFEADARAAGATGFIIADTAAGSRPELRRIQLVAPTSTDERIALAASETDGWLYLVTLTGTTGARTELSNALTGLAARTRALTDVPLYAGFGISTPEQARAAADLDGRDRGGLAGGAGGRGRPTRTRGLRRVAARRARRLTGERARQRRSRPTGHGSPPTRTSIFPMFSPASRPMKAAGAFSIPSTTVSR